MLIMRTSMISGITREKEIDVTQEQLDEWEAGMLIQNAMPNLSIADREFLISGNTQEEWDKLFKDIDDE